MDSLPVQFVLLVLWLGAGAYGAHLLLQKGYKVGLIRFIAFFIGPVLAILYLILNQVQPLDASWPSNLPGVAVNVLLVGTMILVSPALLLAAYLVPLMKI